MSMQLLKTKIICLIGASGSGKSTVAKRLEGLGYNVIQSFTTRPPREEGEWGHTFIDYHTTVENAPHNITILCDKGLFTQDDMIAYFNSYKSGHHYFAVDEQVKRGRVNIYIVDSNGSNQVIDYYKGNPGVDVVVVYLATDKLLRIKRMIDRGDTPQEVKNRIVKDSDFFQVVKCDYVVDGNQNINDVVDGVIRCGR